MNHWRKRLTPFWESRAPMFIHLAAARSGHIPFCCRGYGFLTDTEPDRIWIFILRSQWRKIDEYLAYNQELAVLMTSGEDNESYQIKGRFLERRTMNMEEVSALEHMRAMASLYASGLESLYMVSPSDCLSIGIGIRSTYVQTPGPEAGARLAEGEDFA